PAWERGLEDTWKLDPGETVEVAAKFTDHTGIFMIHCHMLDHEDHGLMAQFKVVRPARTGSAARTSVLRALFSPSSRSTSMQAVAALTAVFGGLSKRPAVSMPSSRKFMCGPRKAHRARRAARLRAAALLA
ncbi:MAG: hypothetical protein QOJ03_244, partial [Frankiaceae bacterium]|nr:hypothetical protein [Frankiaceae bacterium]